MPFWTQPQLAPHGDLFKLMSHIMYEDKYGIVFTVPAVVDGRPVVTDFASVPRVAVWLLPKFGKWTNASIMHDWGCEYGIRQGYLTSIRNDEMFREIMEEDGVTWLARWLMWAGVRWGALGTKHRRKGWFNGFGKLIGMSLIGLVILPPAAVGILWGQLVFGLIQWPTSALMDEPTTSGVEVST